MGIGSPENSRLKNTYLVDRGDGVAGPVKALKALGFARDMPPLGLTLRAGLGRSGDRKTKADAIFFNSPLAKLRRHHTYSR